ncbi:MAG: hypothetical protein Kow0020_03150 [Wenzhouxiangellaceae bacterium]
MRTMNWIILSAALVLSGCGQSEPGPDAGAISGARSGSGEGNGLLAVVDADTAYAFANLERLPEQVANKMWEINDAVAQSGNTTLADLLEEDEDVPAPIKALIREISALQTRAGWTGAGFHENPYYALYAVDLLPVLQLELADADAFSAFIARIEGELGTPLPERVVNDVAVRWLELEPGIGVAIAWDEDSVTVALVPDDEAMLARVTGHYQPPKAFTPRMLEDFNRQNGFGAHGSGFVDWRRIVATLVGDTAPPAWLEQAGLTETLRSDAACVAEFQALADHMPRLIAGYTRIDVHHADMLVRQELAPELAAGLKAVAAAPVNIDRELDGLINFGVAFDLLAARSFLASLVDQWVASPPKCKAFAEIAEQAPAWQQALARPIPPVVSNLQGLFVELRQLDASGPLPAGGGVLAMYMRNPEVLVGMAEMFAPALAELQLKPGDAPKKVPNDLLPQLEQTGLEAWMAMGANAIGIAVGEENVQRLEQAIDSGDGNDLLYAQRMDMSVLTRFIEMAKTAVADDEEALAALEAQGATYEALAKLYREVAFKLRLSDQGIDLIVDSELR